MKVLLVNPPRVDGYSVVREEKFEHRDVGSVYPPLNLLTLAAILEEEHEVAVIDANGFDCTLEQVVEKMTSFKPDVVIHRLGFDTQREDLLVSDAAKKCGAITIVRNKIISDVPELRKLILESMFVDYFVNGELEAVVPVLVNSLARSREEADALNGISFLKDGCVITTPPAQPVEDLDTLPFPAYHLVGSLDPYFSGIYYDHFTAVLSSHGCPFRCTFCAYGRQKCRLRSPEHVVAELVYLKENYGLKNFLFFDDTFTFNRDRALAICSLIVEKKLDLCWSTCTRANLVDDELMRSMKEAGCAQIAFGVESGSAQILQTIKKGVLLDDVREAARVCRKHNVYFSALVILGLPGETEQTIQETVQFIKEIDPFYTQFTTAIPFPNAEMYSYYAGNGFIVTDDWSKYCTIAEPIVRTEALSTEDLVRLRKKAYMQVVLRPKYLFSRIRWTDWKWTLFAAGSLMKRLYLMFAKNIVR